MGWKNYKRIWLQKELALSDIFTLQKQISTGNGALVILNEKFGGRSASVSS